MFRVESDRNENKKSLNLCKSYPLYKNDNVQKYQSVQK